MPRGIAHVERAASMPSSLRMNASTRRAHAVDVTRRCTFRVAV